jgi:hypothetical protein
MFLFLFFPTITEIQALAFRKISILPYSSFCIVFCRAAGLICGKSRTLLDTVQVQELQNVRQSIQSQLNLRDLLYQCFLKLNEHTNGLSKCTSYSIGM